MYILWSPWLLARRVPSGEKQQAKVVRVSIGTPISWKQNKNERSKISVELNQWHVCLAQELSSSYIAPFSSNSRNRFRNRPKISSFKAEIWILKSEVFGKPVLPKLLQLINNCWLSYLFYSLLSKPYKSFLPPNLSCHFMANQILFSFPIKWNSRFLSQKVIYVIE